MKPDSEATASPSTPLWRTRLQRWRVPLGFLTSLTYLFLTQPSWTSLLVGFPIAVAGVLVRGWASGHLRKNQQLATLGPYAHTRNPLYFGSFLLVVGCAVGGGSWGGGAALVGLFLLIYWPVMQAEATHIEQLFGDDYRAWAAEVPLFLPRLRPASRPSTYPDARGASFDRAQYLRHREYRVSIGLLLVFGFLVGRILSGS
jgi:hypothetical protein